MSVESQALEIRIEFACRFNWGVGGR